MRNIFFTLLLGLFAQTIIAQTGTIKGTVLIEGERVEFAQILINATNYGAITNTKGEFNIGAVPYGNYQVVASFMGFLDVVKEVSIDKNQTQIVLDFDLTEQTLELDAIVVTGTKTFKKQTDSPVIVDVVTSQMIDNVQACNLSESLRFQPGLRVETDCQTCNYTQLRINGLAGGYSQILINGRPIFSPLTGLYGLEQLPSTMIDRIEVVKGAGSSLYGSSAIGGTVNVITKLPRKNSYELDYNYQNINGQTSDNVLNGNASLVSENRNSGVSIFLSNRDRDFYDDNGDNFSEIPLISNTSFGASMFLLPSENQKIELNVSKIYEYRLGGEMITNKPAFLTKQSEERTHNVWMMSADYQINFNNDNNSLITYFAWQNTDRKHYTGIQPDKGTVEFDDFISEPPYGDSEVSTYNVGIQLNHSINSFLKGKNILTLGLEYVYDDVYDEISAYSYLVDQTTKNAGIFLQSDWQLLPQLSILSGARIDKHNLIEKAVINPRVSLLYKLKKNTQFRLNYGTGFRAPQAFDADLHIAFAGGGISRILLSPELKQEKSQSFSASMNYDKPMDTWIAGFTIEGFHNRLNDAFFLQPIGEDEFGERFEKQNRDGAIVKGVTIELRVNYNRKIQLEGGYTRQTSKFDYPVQYIDEVEGIIDFIRTPDNYGYAVLNFTPNTKWNATLNYVYTGSMILPHFAGAPNQLRDEIVTTKEFSELSAKVSYTFPLSLTNNILEVYGGVKNILYAYQDDFDIGKNRDSNYVYGPAQPRTAFVGLKMMFN